MINDDDDDVACGCTVSGPLAALTGSFEVQEKMLNLRHHAWVRWLHLVTDTDRVITSPVVESPGLTVIVDIHRERVAAVTIEQTNRRRIE